MMNLKRKKFLLPILTLVLVFILSACSLDKNKELIITSSVQNKIVKI